MFHQLENKPNIAHDNLRSTNTQCLNCQLEAGKTKTLMVYSGHMQRVLFFPLFFPQSNMDRVLETRSLKVCLALLGHFSKKLIT